MTITTTEEVYEDGNRATTIYRDGMPVLIVTMGDGEDPDDYWENYAASLGWIAQDRDDNPGKNVTPPDEVDEDEDREDFAWDSGDDPS